MTDTSKALGTPVDLVLGPLPEPLFLLHCGAVFGGERDEWDVEASSGRAVDLVADMHPGQTLGLYTEHAVRGLLAKERERWAPLVAELLSTELGELACAGSHAPVEDVLGRLKDVLGPNVRANRPARGPQE